MMNRVVIFGDSYSTHKEYIPEGYAHYYCTEGRDPLRPITKMAPEDTWCMKFIERTGCTIVRNDSWSGSTIGYMGYTGDCSTSSSFIYRYRKLAQENFFAENGVDTIIVFGGTNDSWADVTLGEEKYADFCEDDLYNVLPAICYFMITLRNNHPNARVVFIANCDIKPEIIDCMRKVAKKVNVEYVELHDVHKVDRHPSALGMTQICDQIIEQIEI